MLITSFKQVNVIGHRGACGYAPENTIASFKAAERLNVRWIEFDVMQAACGTPVVFHDDTLERTTNGAGFLHDLTYEELKTLDAGAWFGDTFKNERIPTLIDVIRYFEHSAMSFNVELKASEGKDKELVECVLTELQPYLKNHNHRFLFSSFSTEAMVLLRQASPSIHLGLLMHEWVSGWETLAKALQCQSIHIYEEILTPDFAQHIKSSGYDLLAYTVNQAERASELFAMGVDAVFSDYPDRIVTG